MRTGTNKSRTSNEDHNQDDDAGWRGQIRTGCQARKQGRRRTTSKANTTTTKTAGVKMKASTGGGYLVMRGGVSLERSLLQGVDVAFLRPDIRVGPPEGNDRAQP